MSRSSHPLVLPVIILNIETKVSNVSLAPCSSRLYGFKKTQWEKEQKEETVCAQITTRYLLQVSEAAFLLFSSAFLMFPIFILYPKVYYLFLISFPSLFFHLSMLNCKRTQIFFTKWLLKITSVKHQNVK